MEEDSRFGNSSGDRYSRQDRYSSSRGQFDSSRSNSQYNSRSNGNGDYAQPYSQNGQYDRSVSPRNQYDPNYQPVLRKQQPAGYNESDEFTRNSYETQRRDDPYRAPMQEVNVDALPQKKKGLFSIFKKNKDVAPTNFDTSGQNMIITKPRSYQDVKMVIDNLRRRQALIVEFSRIPEKHVQRILDFMSGAVYALGGSQHRIGDKMFLLTPEGMSIQVPIDIKGISDD